MKIEYCAKEPQKITVDDLKAGDVFRFKSLSSYTYMAVFLGGCSEKMLYFNLQKGHADYISSIRDELRDDVEILEAELKVYG